MTTSKFHGFSEKKRSIYAKKDNNEYETLSEQIKINIAKGAQVWIPELCEKLKMKYLPDSELQEEELRERNKRIHDRLMDDWADGKPWSDTYVRECMPEWVKNPNHVAAGKISLAKAMKTKAERRELRQKIEGVFKQIPQPPKEVIEEIKEEITPTEYNRGAIAFPTKETVEEEIADPESLHDEAMRAYGRLWEALADKNDLPGDTTDVFVESIKATRNHRLRILKGLDDVRRIGFMNQTRHLHLLLADLLNMDKELLKEEKYVGK